MVQKLDLKNCDNCMRAPAVFDINIKRGDTLVLQMDQEEFDIKEGEQMLKLWSEAFPHNRIMLTWKGLEVRGVIHE